MAAALTATEAPDLVVVSGHLAGARIPLLPGQHLLGRGALATVALSVPGVSRQHAEVVISHTGGCTIRDLGSTNGTFINGVPLDAQPHTLNIGDQVHLGRAVTLQVCVASVSSAAAQAETLGDESFDPITGAYDRRCLAARAERAVALAQRGGRSVALCLLDIEQLARINEEHGPLVGDAALRALADQLQSCQVPGELLARFEDDMFVLLVPGTESSPLAARVQQALHGLRVQRSDGTTVLVRVSAGISDTRSDRLSSAVDLFLLASARLRHTKRAQPGSVCTTTAA